MKLKYEELFFDLLASLFTLRYHFCAEYSNDPEKAMNAEDGSGTQPAVDEIVPVYRRECHTEVQAGSHRYPGRGVYLLKFDNSYSLWRSKTLYYRVYYTR